jgi:putative peptide zinc metalloprotease protein
VGVVGMMQEALFSPRWYRVATLRPQLRAQVELRRQDQRGVSWFLLLDESADDVRRLNRLAYEFVGRCDGTLTVQQIWEALLATRPDEAMTQDEIVRLLMALHERGLVEFDLAADVETVFRARAVKRRRQRLQGVNPLAFRLAMVDPSPLLARLQPLAPWIFSSGMFALWLVAILCAGTTAAMQASELSAHATRLLASPGYLFTTWLMYPVIKAVHETAHALAVQRWGATVRQAGLTLLMLTPVPFVNASAADGFRHRHQRALVSAAGIMAELAIAAFALSVWLTVQPGLVQDVAMLAMLIGAVSTVLVNGNPLMRFDGYYLFCDLLDLRNLALRSQQWWGQFLARRLLGSTPAARLEPLPGERAWLIAYAPLATAYRLGLALAIGLWVGSHSALLGVAVGVFIAYGALLKPLRAAVRAVLGTGSARGVWRGALAAAGVVATLTLIPVPFSTMAQGVVWLPERAQIRAATDGFITRFAARDGQFVHAGELIATLQDERLRAVAATLEADAADLEITMFEAQSVEPDKVPALREKLAYSRAEAARNDEKIAQLTVRAQADGVLVIPHQADQLGGFRKKGELIGHLIGGDPLTVRVALPQEQADLVRARAGVSHVAPVGVRLAEEPARLHAGSVKRDLDGAVSRLPSAALGEPGGGDIAVDPTEKDGMTTRMPVVLMDVEVAGAKPGDIGERIGARALVRFDHGLLPLAQQALRHVRQLLLQHFNPAG